MKVVGKSLQLFLVDGAPDGIVAAEISGWVGRVLITPRTRLSKALEREQTKRTGVYLLVDDIGDDSKLYIGEAENVHERIKSHDSKKEWWSSVIILTSAENDLNKAHAKYMESRLVEIAGQAKKSSLLNLNLPTRSSLSEADVAKVEAFIENVLIVLPALGISSFVVKKRGASNRSATSDEGVIARFELVAKKHRLRATARLEGSDFIVEKGSSARGEWVSKSNEQSSYANLTKNMLKQGVFESAGDRVVFGEDYAFSSPSAAASVVKGYSSNGALSWKLIGADKTYREWEDDQISDS